MLTKDPISVPVPSKAPQGRRISAAGRRRRRGFTIIELVVVVAIIAILTGLAVPAYLDQVRKSRRADATSSLLSSAQVLERCFTRLNAYNADDCPNPAGASADGFYNITVERTATTYTLTAAPTGAQASDDCGTYTLDHLGNKSPAPSNDRCWGS